MLPNFDQSLAFVLVHEGGYVDNPKDPGGATNKGITLKTYSAHLGRMANKAELQQISDHTVATIYRRNYWDAARCNVLPAGLDYALFDFAVNSGVSRAVRTLQGLVGVAQDGVIGDITMDAIRRRKVPDLIEALCIARMKFVRGLKTWPTFGKGWTRRIMGQINGAQTDDIGVIDRAMIMWKNGILTLPVAAAPGKALEVDTKIATTIKAGVVDPAVLTAAGGILSAVLTAGAGEGPLAYGVAGALVLVALAGVVMVLRR